MSSERTERDGGGAHVPDFEAEARQGMVCLSNCRTYQEQENELFLLLRLTFEAGRMSAEEVVQRAVDQLARRWEGWDSEHDRSPGFFARELRAALTTPTTEDGDE